MSIDYPLYNIRRDINHIFKNHNHTQDKIFKYLEIYNHLLNNNTFQENIKHALQILYAGQIYSFYTDSVLGSEMEVQVIMYHENERIELTVIGPNNITLLHENGDDEVLYEENLNVKDSIDYIIKFGKKTWNLSGLSTPKQSLLMTRSSAYQVLHFVIRPIRVESPFFPMTVR